MSEEAEPAAKTATGVSVELPGGAYVSESAGYEKTQVEMPVAEADEDAEIITEMEIKNLGIEINMPKDENWIKILSEEVDLGIVKIDYCDLIADTNCSLTVMKLPKKITDEYSTDWLKARGWETVDSDTDEFEILDLQYEGKVSVLIGWYCDRYTFEIHTRFPDNNYDLTSLKKTAKYIKDNSKLITYDSHASSDSPGYTENAD